MSTLFAYPFVGRTKRFNFPHSIEPFVPVHSAVFPNISSSAIVDAAIVATLPLMRHALIARIRSRAIAPFFTQSLTDAALAPTTRAAADMLAPSMRI